MSTWAWHPNVHTTYSHSQECAWQNQGLTSPIPYVPWEVNPLSFLFLSGAAKGRVPMIGTLGASTNVAWHAVRALVVVIIGSIVRSRQLRCQCFNTASEDLDGAIRGPGIPTFASTSTTRLRSAAFQLLANAICGLLVSCSKTLVLILIGGDIKSLSPTRVLLLEDRN